MLQGLWHLVFREARAQDILQASGSWAPRVWGSEGIGSRVHRGRGVRAPQALMILGV